MTEPKFHRGAAVGSSGRSAVDQWLARFQPKAVQLHPINPQQELTGAELAQFSKPFRRRRKGPIVRFGGRKS